MFQFPRFAPLGLCIQPKVTGHYPRRVPPFGHPGINACVQLPLAYRSLPRPSSPTCAQASTVCPYSLDPFSPMQLKKRDFHLFGTVRSSRIKTNPHELATPTSNASRLLLPHSNLSNSRSPTGGDKKSPPTRTGPADLLYIKM